MTVELVSVGAWAAFDRILELDGNIADGATVSVRSSQPDHDDYFYGDCSPNVAAVAASLGTRVGLATVVGEDFNASGYRDHLEKLGIDLRGVIIHPGASSGWNLNISTPDGSSFCISHRDASRHQDQYSPPADLIAKATWVVISEAFGRYSLAAATLARQAGVSVALNGMVASAGDLATEFIVNADLLFINEAESETLANLLGPGHGPDKRVVTRGSRETMVIDGGDIWSVKPIPVDPVIDQTGAGDALAGATMAALLRGYPLEGAVRFGSAAAACVIGEVGCQTNLPTWADLMERMKSQP
jgi:ribokinase